MTTPKDGVAWITGASSGIGEAVALRLAREGWTVVASARRADKLAEIATRVQGKGAIVPLALDVTDLEAVKAAAAHIETDVGAVALMILNAGTYKPDGATKLDSADYRAHVELNLMGTVHCLDAVLPRMIDRRRGHVAIVASVAGYRGLPRALAYGATKAALINLAESLKLDLDRFDIKTQIVNPGFIKTPLTDKNDFPMPFLMPVEDAAERFVAGLKSKRFEIVFPKVFAFMLQRMRCMPYRLYFALTKNTVRK